MTGKTYTPPLLTARHEINRLKAINVDLLAALELLHECSPCQNGCAPDDMSCASNVARAAIAKARGE